MDPILELYNSMKSALQSGHSIDDVNKEIARRGFNINGAPATFADLAKRASEISGDQGAGSFGVPGALSAASHAATLGLDKKFLGAMAAADPNIAPDFGVDRNAPAGARYTGVRDAVDSTYHDVRTRRPGATALTELATGLLTTPALGGPEKGLWTALRRGAMVGGGYGGVQGFADAPEGHRLEGLGKGAALGAAAGIPLAGAAHLTSSLFPAVRATNRLNAAVEAEGGPGAVRAAAGRTAAAGYGNINPVGSLGPYLQGEAENAAIQSPSVFAKYRHPIVSRQMDETDRLTRNVSDIFGVPQVGREALVDARRAQFDPVYETLNKSAGRIEDPRIANILGRPVVKAAYGEAVQTGMIADQVESLPSFGQLNELREMLYSKARSLQESPGGDKRRMAALYDAAHEVESVLEDNVPDFRALQTAYRETSRPINVIDLARLETAKAGRASPAIDRASREDRRALLRAFGSSQKYKQFMGSVEQERQLADFNGQVFGGSKTARVIGGTSEMQPEDMARAAVHPAWGAAHSAGAALGKSAREATARAIAPSLFGPAADIDRILTDLARRSRAPLRRAGELGLPAAGGMLLGGPMFNPDDYERDLQGRLVKKQR